MLVDAKLMIDGKVLETQIEIDEAELEVIQNKTGYERAAAAKAYFYINGDGMIRRENDMRFDSDDLRFAVANYYSTEKVADNNARADQLMRQLRRFAVENRTKEINWKSDSMSLKYYIYYSYNDNSFGIGEDYSVRDFGTIYFDSEETAKNAISEFYDELIWYFTEYKYSL